jgi:hypothetical protein
LNSHVQEITIDNLFEIRKKSALEGVEEPETKRRERIMTV